MKALFLAEHQVSHTHDTLFNAIYKYLGGENTHDYPCYPKYHTNHKLPGDQYSWWCFTENKHTLSLTLENWAELINNGSVRWIFCSNRGEAPKNLFKLISMIDEKMFRDICITFIEEEHDLGFDLHRKNVEMLMPIWDKIDIYFRMDYVKESVCNYEKIIPLYLCAPTDKLNQEVNFKIKNFEEREYDVCYMVGSSHPNRKLYYEILKNNLKLGNNIIEYGNHKYSLTDYFNVINNSKIFISVRGNEYHNTRNIEGPYLGAGLFCESLPTTVPYDYQDGISCVYYNSNNIIDLLIHYLNDKDKLKSLSLNSKKHCDLYHTDFARASQFFELAKKIKGW